MTITNATPKIPAIPEEQLRWLVDRAAISDLLTAFSRSLDARDGQSLHALLADDVVFVMGDRVISDGRDEFVKAAVAGMSRYHATWHFPASPGIDIDGDTAKSRSYHMGVHVLDAVDRNRHGDGAGWYDCEYRRADDGWRFTRIQLTVVWTGGEADRPIND
jgi:hypothetical protein